VIVRLPLLAAVLLGLAASAAQAEAPTFGAPIKLKGAAGGTEPRVAVGPGDRRWVVTNETKTGNAIVFGSSNRGRTWTRTAGEPAGQVNATIDTDIVVTRTGRIIASELDSAGINFVTSYSDDRGKTWTESQGTKLADTDRQWFAAGTDDPVTHQPRVYLLFHNLGSGTTQHNMFVATSHDNGATFGVPVPVTLPPEQAYQDLQCADSGGPSAIFTSSKGRVYVVWGSRTSPAFGGCGASVFGPFEVNVVAATRVWAAVADGDGQSWTPSLAVDDGATNHIVGMQLSPGAVDQAGNVYVTYPDYTGAAIRYVHTGPDLGHWSKPVTVAPSGGPGNILPHIVAGARGGVDFAYYKGQKRRGDPAWHLTAAQTLDALSAHPHITHRTVSSIAAYTGTSSKLMGACGEGPAQGVENGFACGRATDVWGVDLDRRGLLTIAWPTVKNQVKGSAPNTYVSTQTGGPGVDGCRDRSRPRSRFGAVHLGSAGAFASGSARDLGCHAGLARVRVAIAQRSRHEGRCRFLRRDGSLSATRSCHSPLFLRAHGTTHWALVTHRALPAGQYQLAVRATDRAGNTERAARRNVTRLRVR
jgi:hypothetical protein